MTVSILKKSVLFSTPLIAAMAFAAPASAGTSQAQIEACKVKTVVETGIDADAHDISFKTSTAKTIKLDVRPLDGGESFTVTCRMRGGKIKSAKANVPLTNVKLAQNDK